jgi:hypothetical protein
LTSSNTAFIAFSMRGPSKPPAPVNGVRMPSCSGAPCARLIDGAAKFDKIGPSARAPAPLTKLRREAVVM